MKSIITGDIINSRFAKSPKDYLEILKRDFVKIGNEPKDWQIIRGDSFQLKIINPGDALHYAIFIKSAIKTLKGLDVRLAIGIGEISYEANSISECNGSAFINSGEMFEIIKKKKVTLAVKSPWDNFDKEINLLLKIASIFMDGWSVKSAQVIYHSLKDRNTLQEELGKILKVKQSTISERQKRAHLTDVNELIDYYKNKISNVITH